MSFVQIFGLLLLYFYTDFIVCWVLHCDAWYISNWRVLLTSCFYSR